MSGPPKDLSGDHLSGELTTEQIRSAQLTVAENTLDPDDRLDLLTMLGIDRRTR